MTDPLPPLTKGITVPWPPDAAFRRFTSGITQWWPLRTHSVGEDRAERVVFEERVGGRIYEVERSGVEHTWGTVTGWDPPRSAAFTWHPGRTPDTSQQIEVRFTAAGSGTRVELTHTGWERLGKMARVARRGYPLGWAYVLRLYADRRSSPVVLAVDAFVGVLKAARRLRGGARV